MRSSTCPTLLPIDAVNLLFSLHRASRGDTIYPSIYPPISLCICLMAAVHEIEWILPIATCVILDAHFRALCR